MALGWTAVALVTALVFPGGSYLFSWPVIFSLAGYLLADKFPKPLTQTMLSILAALPAILLAIPFIYSVFLALPMLLMAAGALVAAYLAGLLLPQLLPPSSLHKRFLPGALLVLGLALIGVGNLSTSYDAQHPKPVGLFTLQNKMAGLNGSQVGDPPIFGMGVCWVKTPNWPV